MTGRLRDWETLGNTGKLFPSHDIKYEQELIGQQYNSGKISENTYNTLNKNLEKNRTELELKTTGLISERNRNIDNEIPPPSTVL